MPQSYLVLGAASTQLANKFKDELLTRNLEQLRADTSEFKLYATDIGQRMQKVIDFRRGFLKTNKLEDRGLRILPLLPSYRENDSESFNRVSIKISPPALTGAVWFCEHVSKVLCKGIMQNIISGLGHHFHKGMPLVLVTLPQISSGSFNREEPTGLDFRQVIDLPHSRKEVVELIIRHLQSGNEGS